MLYHVGWSFQDAHWMLIQIDPDRKLSRWPLIACYQHPSARPKSVLQEARCMMLAMGFKGAPTFHPPGRYTWEKNPIGGIACESLGMSIYRSGKHAFIVAEYVPPPSDFTLSTIDYSKLVTRRYSSWKEAKRMAFLSV